jgi:hypothetical protein
MEKVRFVERVLASRAASSFVGKLASPHFKCDYVQDGVLHCRLTVAPELCEVDGNLASGTLNMLLDNVSYITALFAIPDSKRLVPKERLIDNFDDAEVLSDVEIESHIESIEKDSIVASTTVFQGDKVLNKMTSNLEVTDKI